VKLPAHRAALPGNESSFVIVPLKPVYKTEPTGHTAGQPECSHTKISILSLPFPGFLRFNSISPISPVFLK